MRNIRWLLFFVVVWLAVGLACNMPQIPAPQAAPPQADGQPAAQGQPAAPAEATQEMNVQPEAPAPQPTPLPTHPRGLRKGLADLNSYRISTTITMNGPGEQDKNTSVSLVEYVKEGDLFHSRSETTTSSADSPEASVEVTEQYRVDGKTCEFSPGSDDPSAEIEDAAAGEQGMLSTMMVFFDVVVYADNPQLVGIEEVNGFQTYHYTFDASQAAVIQGVEVAQAAGEYWFMVEEQTLVRYHALIEMRAEGESGMETLFMQVDIDLLEADTPIQIAMPPQCQ
ncbi:MAG: hypothetical protein L0Z70_04600 [Chloroflexi bacterium]|nr:hypothetical protein [Chloroflexota bacterium]